MLLFASRTTTALGVLFLFSVVLFEARAQLKADPAALDLGRQVQNQVVAAEVKLTNVGLAPLSISGVTADCSCTVAKPEKSTLAPGETTSLKISVETRAALGVLHRVVRVASSAGELVLPIELAVSNYKSWQLVPATPVMPPSTKGRVAEVAATLQFTGEGKTQLGEISCTPNWLEVVADTVDGKLFKLKFSKRPETPAGNHTVNVVVATADPGQPTLTFNLFMPVSSELRVVPNPVVLPTVKVGQASLREISVLGWSGDEAPRLELIRGEAKALGQTGGKWQFELLMTPSAPGPYTQLLRVYSGQKLEAEIPVIVRAEPLDKVP